MDSPQAVLPIVQDWAGEKPPEQVCSGISAHLSTAWCQTVTIILSGFGPPMCLGNRNLVLRLVAFMCTACLAAILVLALIVAHSAAY